MLKNVDADPNGGCKHKPPAVIVDATGRGYRIRCLTCGAVGPQRQESGEAWADLEGWRYQEANLRRRTPLY
jgi:hypothetical protein